MIFTVEPYSNREWIGKKSEFAHFAAFGERRSSQFERVDFAIVVSSESAAVGYVQCIEMDSETVYWQFGGAFPDSKKTLSVSQAYRAGVEWCSKRFKRITTRIENTNIQMLKLAMSVGFLIQGVWVFKGITYLELCRETEGGL